MQTLNISEDIHYLLKKKLAFTSSSPLVNEENIFSMEHFPTVSRSSLNITVHENNTSCCQSSSRSFFQLQASKLTKRWGHRYKAAASAQTWEKSTFTFASVASCMSSNSQWRRGWTPEGPDPIQERPKRLQNTRLQIISCFVSLNLSTCYFKLHTQAESGAVVTRD